MAPRFHAPRNPPRPPWRWAGAGALAGVLAILLTQAPASWLTRAVNQASAGRVSLVESRGTVWQGSAQLRLTGGAGSQDVAALPGRVHWRLGPQAGGLAITLSADCCTPEPLTLRVDPRWNGLHMRVGDSLPDQPSIWPAALLTGLGAPWNTLHFEGTLRLRTQDLSIDWAAGRLGLTGHAELVAAGLSSRLSTLRPMGSYRITVNGGQASTLALTTIDGALQLSGSGRWVGSRLHFEGVASAAPEREAALSNLLNILGRRDGPRSLIRLG